MDSIHSPFASAERIISQLQAQQHLRPHQTVVQAIDRAGLNVNSGPAASRQAVDMLRIDPLRKIGRLKGCEVTQLARAIWRLSRDAAASRSAVAAAS